MSDSNVISLRGGAPALNDIPGMLQLMADEIDAGEYGDVGSAIVLLPVEGDYPMAFGWGNVQGQNDPIIQCELAKAWFVSNLVRRS